MSPDPNDFTVHSIDSVKGHASLSPLAQQKKTNKKKNRFTKYSSESLSSCKYFLKAIYNKQTFTKDAANQPKVAAKQPKDAAKLPKDAAKQPKDAAKQPKDAAKQPKDTAKQPKDTAKQPKDTAKQPKDTAKQPKDTVIQYILRTH
ncbi:hypothetical protein TNCV_4972601 [Trichonephila clavipes]|nr:hypothetical protein TNCV_4972601 [Trichonephila clavipes]